MTVMIKKFLIAGLIAGTASAPVLAQPDNRRPNVVDNRPNAGPQRPGMRYREVTVTRANKWRKGQRLARNQRRYVVNDWNRQGLRQPPRGYQWVRERNNSGDYLLVATATGLISSILSR